MISSSWQLQHSLVQYCMCTPAHYTA
jgi:hypothetical protein